MRLALQLSIIFMLLTGCSADPQTGGPPMVRPDAGMGIRPDAKPGQVDPPMLGPLPETTYWPAIPVHGDGPPGGTILIMTPKSGALTVPVQGNGAFCVDVPLEANALNQFDLRAQDRDGNLSEPVRAQVRQQGTPPPPPGPGPSTNVALGGTVRSTLWYRVWCPSMWCEGPVLNLIDNDPVTLFEGYNQGLFGTPPDWAWVRLSARSRINRVRVFSPADCVLAQYSVLVSDRDAPGDPSESSQDWIKVGELTNGDGDDEVSFQPAAAGHVALYFKSHDCGRFFEPGYHKIGEVQAWTQPDQAPPPPRPPTCGGGG